MTDNLPLQDSSFGELEELATTFPNDDEVRELVQSELERRDSLDAQILLERIFSDSHPAEEPTQADVGDAESLLEGFLDARNLTAPNGQALYRYQTRSDELEAFRTALESELDGYWVTKSTAMVFCLWASEWWRRHYVGGPWKWESLLEATGHSEFAPGHSRYEDLQQLVMKGLRAWDRPILKVGRARGFLVTLACEGGLPLMLVLREQTHLRAYLRGVLEEFRLFSGSEMSPRDLAERVRDRLPKSLRQKVVYELSGELIRQVWILQREIGETRTPVRDLDASHPGWRDELPVRVTDAIARTLLNGLLLDAVEVARGSKIKVRWNVTLRPKPNDDWGLEGSFHLPPSLERQDFNMLFARAPDAPVPQRFDLSVEVDGEAARVLAVGTDRARAAEPSLFGIEAMRLGRATWTAGLDANRRLLARARDETFTSDVFPGANGLTELPWIFLPDDLEDDSRQKYRLAGQGSLNLREPWAVVAAADDDSVSPGPDGSTVEIGRLESYGRTLYEVRGRIETTSADGTRTVVATRAEKGTTAAEYRLRGVQRHLGRDSDPCFVGPPALHERDEVGFSNPVDPRYLEWRPHAPGAQWGPYAPDSRGEGRIRYVKDGAVQHVANLRIIPRDARVEIEPSADDRSGVIRLSGFAAEHVSVDADSGLSVHPWRHEGVHELTVNAPDEPPSEVTVAMDWEDGARLQLRVPFPTTRARFVTPDGRWLPLESRISVGSLAGVRSEVIVPYRARFEVHGQYYGADTSTVKQQLGLIVTEIPEVTSGHYQLDLAMLHPLIEERLTLGEDPDAMVRIWIHTDHGGEELPLQRVHVSRFDLALQPGDAELPLVRLDDTSRSTIDSGDLARLELEAVSLLEPDEPAVPLERWRSDEWLVPEETMRPGPYYILGRQADWYRVRPVHWYVAPPGGGPTEPVRRPTDLAGLYQSGLPAYGNLGPFVSVTRSLGQDPGHRDWSTVFGYLQMRMLPPEMFPLIRAVARSPAACTMAAMVASEAQFDVLWERLEELPFAWWQLPLSSWETAYERFIDGRTTLYGEIGDENVRDQLLAEDLDAIQRRVSSRLPGLSPVLAFSRSHALARPVDDDAKSLLRPGLRELLRHQYVEHRFRCPSTSMSPSDIPNLSKLVTDLSRLQARHSWIGELLVDRMGKFEHPARANFADAPAHTAILKVLSMRPTHELGAQIRAVRRADPAWFDEALRLADLVAFSTMKQAQTQEMATDV